MTAKELFLGTAVEIIFFGIAIGVLYRVWGFFFGLPKRQLVLPYQSGVRLKRGRIQAVVPPGVYWTNPNRPILLCDTRPSPFRMDNHVSSAADGVPVVVTLLGEYRIVDPTIAIMATTNLLHSFHLQLQQGWTATIAEWCAVDALNSPENLFARLRERISPHAATLGIEITQLSVQDLRSLQRPHY